ncbi:MAG: DUF222 domain-containing protein [Acidimicrobiia bacterium]|nr:DUF222 domain-containing protein [Acidimicrobiia bacterium]
MTTVVDRPRADVPMFTADLVDLLVERHRVVVSVEAQCLELVGELVRRGGHEDLGYRSLVSLLCDRLGISAGVARGMIRLATALEEMPATRVALQLGVLDLPRVRLLVSAREANPILFAEHESGLVDTIEGLAMDQVGRVLGYWCQQADLDACERDAESLREQRRLFVSTVGGMVHLDGRLDPVSGQVVITALAALTDAANLDGDDHRSPAQRRADALTDLCRGHLDHGDLPTQRTERPHVVVHLSLEALEGRAGHPCELDDTGVIAPSQARLLACDARVTRVITGSGSQVLDVGRTTRVVPAAMRLALMVRDRGCVIPGCGAPRRWCDAHHIVHWADGGPTSWANLVLLCARHHTLVHEGKVRLPQRE